GGLPGSLRHWRGPTPLLGLPGTKATAEGLTRQLSLRTTLRSPPSWCSMTTVRSSTARTRTCLPSTIALNPPLTSWLGGGTMLASDTRSTILFMSTEFLWLGGGRSAAENKAAEHEVRQVRSLPDVTWPPERPNRR